MDVPNGPCAGGDGPYCEALQQVLSGGRPIETVFTMNVKTGKFRTLGVGFKRKANDRHLMFNICPFCAQALDQAFNTPDEEETQ